VWGGCAAGVAAMAHGENESALTRSQEQVASGTLILYVSSACFRSCLCVGAYGVRGPGVIRSPVEGAEEGAVPHGQRQHQLWQSPTHDLLCLLTSPFVLPLCRRSFLRSWGLERTSSPCRSSTLSSRGSRRSEPALPRTPRAIGPSLVLGLGNGQQRATGPQGCTRLHGSRDHARSLSNYLFRKFAPRIAGRGWWWWWTQRLGAVSRNGEALLQRNTRGTVRVLYRE